MAKYLWYKFDLENIYFNALLHLVYVYTYYIHTVRTTSSILPDYLYLHTFILYVEVCKPLGSRQLSGMQYCNIVPPHNSLNVVHAASSKAERPL